MMVPPHLSKWPLLPHLTGSLLETVLYQSAHIGFLDVSRCIMCLVRCGLYQGLFWGKVTAQAVKLGEKEKCYFTVGKDCWLGSLPYSQVLWLGFLVKWCWRLYSALDSTINYLPFPTGVSDQASTSKAFWESNQRELHA